MAFPRQRGGLTRVATTGAGGFALENGTPTILEWTAPDDGELHAVIVQARLVVTSAETGGQVLIAFDGGGVSGGGDYHLSDGTQGTGDYVNGSNTGEASLPVHPGEKVTVLQATALTAGAAILYAEIWAS